MEICEVVNNNRQGLSLRIIDETLKEDSPYMEYQIPIFESHFGLRELAFENSFVIGLNIKNVPYLACRLSIGDIDSVSSCHKQTLIFCLVSGCKSFYTLHNHPSNLKANPSEADIENERQIDEISNIVGIEYKGEIVIAKDQWSITHDGKTYYFDWNREELEELEDYER